MIETKIVMKASKSVVLIKSSLSSLWKIDALVKNWWTHSPEQDFPSIKFVMMLKPSTTSPLIMKNKIKHFMKVKKSATPDITLKFPSSLERIVVFSHMGSYLVRTFWRQQEQMYLAPLSLGLYPYLTAFVWILALFWLLWNLNFYANLFLFFSTLDWTRILVRSIPFFAVLIIFPKPSSFFFIRSPKWSIC